MANIKYQGMGDLVVAKTAKAGKSSRENKALVTFALPLGTTFGKVYIVVSPITTPRDHPFHEFLSKPRWIQVTPTEASKDVFVRGVNVSKRLVMAEAHVWTSRDISDKTIAEHAVKFVPEDKAPKLRKRTLKAVPADAAPTPAADTPAA